MGPNGGRTSSFNSSEVTQAVSHLPPDQVTADLTAVADYALKFPSARRKLFVAGFCWGGGQTFRFATNRPDLGAAFVFYGPPPMKPSTNEIDNDAMARITAPVYGFYAGNDARIDATIPATVDAMKEARKRYEPVTYEGAGHGFMRAGEQPGASEANQKARNEAWQRWKVLLEKGS
jgi:carboxymethylenebutenolidase